jgi:hypothetical protein
LAPNITSTDVWGILDRIVTDFRTSDEGRWDHFLPEPKPRAWRVVDTGYGDEWRPASMNPS